VHAGAGAGWATVSGQRRSQLSADPLCGQKRETRSFCAPPSSPLPSPCPPGCLRRPAPGCSLAVPPAPASQAVLAGHDLAWACGHACSSLAAWAAKLVRGQASAFGPVLTRCGLWLLLWSEATRVRHRHGMTPNPAWLGPPLVRGQRRRRVSRPASPRWPSVARSEVHAGSWGRLAGRITSGCS
jgi:hypothetical protein